MIWNDLVGQAVPSAAVGEAPVLTVYFGDEGTSASRVETVFGVFTTTDVQSLLVIDSGDEVGILRRSDVDPDAFTETTGTVVPTFSFAGYGAGDGASLPGEPDLQRALEALTHPTEFGPPEAEPGIAADSAQEQATGDEATPDQGGEEGVSRTGAPVIPLQLYRCPRERCPLRVVAVVGARDVDPRSLRCTKHPDEVLESVAGVEEP